MYKVVVDGHGGDYAPNEVVLGCIEAVKKHNDIKIVLAGNKADLEKRLAQHVYNVEQIEIINATEVITNDEAPTLAIRKKTDSSLVVGLNYVKENEDVAGIVSAGSTGAVLTGAFMKIGRIKGISRPALFPLLPTVNGGVVGIIDVGANMDSKPINLVHFALLGVAYFKSVYSIDKPRVALLSVGSEDKKGNELTKETFAMLKQLDGINFIGNVEARELLSGDFDVVVCDGFAGNVLLKSAEGAISSVLKILKQEISSSILSKIGYLFMKHSFKRLKKKLDYTEHGGAVFLGAKKIVVKSHGNSRSKSIYKSIMQVVDMEKSKLIGNIEKTLQAYEDVFKVEKEDQ